MNIVEIGLSFAEGLALIASPCILPVLPLVLSTSVDGGRKRPFGIILGFVIAFTLFALLSRKLVMAFHIDLDYIKYGSLVLLTMLGLVLISHTLSEKFSAITGRFANIGGNFSANAKDGFFSGIIIGLLIGLVWTPCAGPFLAAVLVQVIRQENDVQALFIISAFAFGAGVPMLIISLTGRKIMSKLGFFTNHGEAVRKIFGVIILLAVGFIASGTSVESIVKEKTMPIGTQIGLINPLETPYYAPEFAGIEAWLNSEPLTMASLKGKVVLVDFWTYSCINCVRTLPYITELDRKYRDKGLVIIGVHSPEFEFEKNKKNVAAALVQHGIKYPVALDNRLDTWTNFKNLYWPAHYLINKQGQVVYTHFGEGHYGETENNIRFLLGLDKVEEKEPEIATGSREQTPETYLGSSRTMNFASPEKMLVGDTQTYSFPEILPKNHWAISGKWKVEDERIIAAESKAKLRFNFTAGKVFLVLGTESNNPINVSVMLNGKQINNMNVNQHTLYQLINQEVSKQGLLEITAKSAGLEAYAFTFGE